MKNKVDVGQVNMNQVKFLDCTLRDGGYHNSWDFERGLINAYLKAMAELNADVVEIGFRLLPDYDTKFKGGCAYCTDEFLCNLDTPINSPDICVMVDGSDLLKYQEGVQSAIDFLFRPSNESPVKMVRVASHVHQVQDVLPAITKLCDLGYKTTLQLMQIAGLKREEVIGLAKMCSSHPIDVLYFADSLGSMVPEDIDQTVDALGEHWKGELGFHAHNNMERALTNCIKAIDVGVSWVDATVLGMGRGSGNACTEYLSMELERKVGRKMNPIPLLALIEKYFRPLMQKYKWGPNPYYYMAGMHGIHPTYIQEMLKDPRFGTKDILAVIQRLKTAGGKRYSVNALEIARNFYSGKPRGSWKPATLMQDRDVLIIGSGPGVQVYRLALEQYIRRTKPYVLALNIQPHISSELIDAHVACHPVRLLADCEKHALLPQPLITPFSMLPDNVVRALMKKEILDYGIGIKNDTFVFEKSYGIVPNVLVFSYALALTNSGKANRILIAGFDGYGADDPRMLEMENVLKTYQEHSKHIEILSVTPTKYSINIKPVYII